MNEEIKIELTESKRGEIVARLTFPDGLLQLASIAKLGDLWHISEWKLADKASAWLRSSNKLFLTMGEARRLRKNGTIRVAANSAHLKHWWKIVHTDRKGMRQPFHKPNLANV